MAHFAELNDNNVVLRVVVTDNNDPNGDEGYLWLVENLGGTWVQTSYNSNFRKQYASVGFTYNPEADVFVTAQPYASWSLDDNFDWQPPTPQTNPNSVWDEASLEWLDLEA